MELIACKSGHKRGITLSDERLSLPNGNEDIKFCLNIAVTVSHFVMKIVLNRASLSVDQRGHCCSILAWKPGTTPIRQCIVIHRMFARKYRGP